MLPKKHSVPLGNYSLRLRDDIKFFGVSETLRNWCIERFGRISEAARCLGMSESFLRSMVGGRKPTPVWLIRRISEIEPAMSDRLFRDADSFTSRCKRDLFPREMTPDLAYYLGFLQGDGHVDRNEKRISFTEASRDHLDVVNEINKSVFGFHGSIYEKPNKRTGGRAYVLDVRRATVNSFVSDVIGINRGKKTRGFIPVCILKERGLLRWYLCGLFDAESSMPKNPRRKSDCYIDIAMADKDMIGKVKSVLAEDFGIMTYGPYKRFARSSISKAVTEESELRIRKYSEIARFMERIGTLHPDKIKRKETMIRLIGSVAQLG